MPKSRNVVRIHVFAAETNKQTNKIDMEAINRIL